MKKPNKILAILVVFCMLGIMLPQLAMPVNAATTAAAASATAATTGSASADISTVSAFDALGIDTTKVPDGVDLDSTDNPYGRNIIAQNEVSELLLQEPDNATLYGNGDTVNGDWAAFLSNGKALSAVKTGNYAATAAASGHFTSTKDSRKAQTVSVATSAASSDGGLYLYFSDPVNNKQSSTPITLLGTDKILGNGTLDEFSELPAYIYNYLKVSAGDYDGDDVDEVAVYVPENGKSPRIQVYDLQIDDAYDENDSENNFLDDGHWVLAWTYILDYSLNIPNMVSIVSGDFNKDGVDDLGFTWGSCFGPNNMDDSQAVILCGDSSSMLTKAITLDVSCNSGPIVRASLACGDIDGDGVKDLVLGGSLKSDFKEANTDNNIDEYNLDTRVVVIYAYTGKGAFSKVSARNFDLLAKSNGDYVYPCMTANRQSGEFYSMPVLAANIAVGSLQGSNSATEIYLDSLLFKYGDSGLELIGACDAMTEFNDPNFLSTEPNFSQRHYVEYGVVSGDYTGSGKQELSVLLYYPKLPTEASGYYTSSASTNVSWWRKLLQSYHEITGGDIDKAFAEFRRCVHVEGLFKSATWTGSGYLTDTDLDFTRENNLSSSASLCKLNCDNDSVYMNYTGSHTVMYSDPKVLAVLASTPYFKDLDRDDLSGSSMESSTSYGTTTGTGTGTTKSSTISMGAYVNFSMTFLKYGQLETGLDYTHGWTEETSSSASTEMSVTYSTIVGQDSVVFYSIPVEVYYYYAYYPVTDSAGNVTGYNKQPLTVNIPHKAAVVLLSLNKYEKIAADFADLPQLSGTVMTHTVGEPSTYPKSSDGYDNVLEYSGDWAGMSYSDVGTSITQQIDITTEKETGYSTSDSLEFNFGGGFKAGDEETVEISLIVGYKLGAEVSSGTVTISTVGNTFSGTIYDLPAEAEEFGYYFAWKLFTYTTRIDGLNVPVVSYLVQDVMMPPILPEDFTQDMSLTSYDTIGLTWSYPGDRSISGFQLYRYYDFPDGSGSYELAFVPASDISSVTYDSDGNAVRHYQYLNTGLSDYTEYSYQIQAIRSTIPYTSIQSTVLTARTTPETGTPKITLEGVTTNSAPVFDSDGVRIGTSETYSLQVYPDTSSTVSVAVEGNYSETPRYQWQKLGSDGWNDIDGATSYQYVFSETGAADEGDYRCRVNTICSDEEKGEIYYITSYSDFFTLDYSLRTAVVTDNGFKADIGSETVSLTLKSAQSNHYFAPSGTVIFNITGAGYNGSYAVSLGDTTSDYTATATLDLGAEDNDGDGITANLPRGAYRITAHYCGSRVFDSLDVSDPVYYVSGSGSGYLLNVDSSCTYGESISLKVLYVHLDDNTGEIVLDTVPLGDDYSIKRLVNNKYEEINSIIQTDSEGNSIIVPTYATKYKLSVTIDGTTLSQEIVVAKRPITVGFGHVFTGVYQNLTAPEVSDLSILSGSMAYSDVLKNLPIGIKAYNAAGGSITLDSNTLPGQYTVTGAWNILSNNSSAASYANYDISFVSSTYTVTSVRYGLTLEAGLFKGTDIVGTVALLSPDIKGTDGSDLTAATTAVKNTWAGTEVLAGGTDIIVQASPQTGYMVKSWTVKTPNTKTTYTNSLKTFTYQTLANDTTITADYQLARNRLYFQTAGGAGTVTAVDASILSGAIVQPGAGYTFLASPADGYHFVEWTVSGSTNSNFHGELDSETGTSTTQLTMGSVDTILTAVMARDSYTLTLADGLQATYAVADGFGGTVETTGTGTLSIPGDTQIKVTPRDGYSIDSTAVWYVNGISAGAGLQSYDFVLSENTAIEVGIHLNKYTVSLTVNQPDTGAGNAVQVLAGNVLTDFSEARTVDGGTSLVFTAMPAWGYVFDHWTVNNASAGTGSTLTIARLASDSAVEAVFVANPAQYLIDVSCTTGGSLEYTILYNKDGYSGNAPSGQSVASGGSAIIVYGGDTLVLTAAPTKDYMLRSWIVDGTLDETSGKVLTIQNIEKSMSVSARFVAKSYSTVTYTAHENGAVDSATCDGTPFSSGDLLGNGSELVFQATPADGYMVDYWTFNGQTILNSDTTPVIDQTLTVKSLIAGSTAEYDVYFTPITEYTISYQLSNATINAVYTPESYKGRTSGNSPVYVRKGSAVSITLVPDSGFRATELIVNGVAQSPDTEGSFSYKVTDLQENLAVTATAAKCYAVSVDGGLMGGSLEISTQKDVGQAVAGEVISLSSVTPDLDHTFGGWFYNGNPVSGTSFLMPAEATTVTASFPATTPVSLTFGASPAAAGTLSATVARIYSNGTSVSGYPYTKTDGSLVVHRGYSDAYVAWPSTVITFKATAGSGYQLSGWKVNGSTVNGSTENCSLSGNTLALTVPRTSADSVAVTALFTVTGTGGSTDTGSTGGSTGGSSGGNGDSSGGTGGVTVITGSGGSGAADTESQLEPENVPLAAGATIFTLKEGQQTITEEEGASLIELNRDGPVIIKGDGLWILILKGVLEAGDDVNNIIPDLTGISYGPGEVVAYLDGQGKTILVPCSVMEDKMVSFIAGSYGRYQVIDKSMEFKDTEKHWGREAIAFTASRGLFAGTGEGLFSPEADTSRAMIVTVLHRLDGLKSGGSETFSDVVEGRWYSDAIRWGNAEEIVEGYGDGRFGPGDSITREQLAAIMYRYAGYSGTDTGNKAELSAYSDMGDISGYATEAMRWAVGEGLLNGRSKELLAPRDKATRAEVAAVMMRFIRSMMGR